MFKKIFVSLSLLMSYNSFAAPANCTEELKKLRIGLSSAGAEFDVKNRYFKGNIISTHETNTTAGYIVDYYYRAQHDAATKQKLTQGRLYEAGNNIAEAYFRIVWTNRVEQNYPAAKIRIDANTGTLKAIFVDSGNYETPITNLKCYSAPSGLTVIGDAITALPTPSITKWTLTFGNLRIR